MFGLAFIIFVVILFGIATAISIDRKEVLESTLSMIVLFVFIYIMLITIESVF